MIPEGGRAWFIEEGHIGYAQQRHQQQCGLHRAPETTPSITVIFIIIIIKFYNLQLLNLLQIRWNKTESYR